MANLPRANLPSFFRPGALWARSESPFRELNRLQRQLDRMMEEWPFSEEGWRPSAMAGAVMAGGTPEQVDALDRYAAELGMVFQIVDDILDVEGGPASFGHRLTLGRVVLQVDGRAHIVTRAV